MNARDEFERVYLDYSDKIFRYLFIQTQDKYLAEDLTADVFVKAYKSWKKFDKEYTQAWLYRIAKNVLIDFWRKKKNKKEISLEIVISDGREPSKEDNIVEEISKEEEIKKLNKALEKLPERLKDIVVLRFIENLSAKETGEILRISEVNVRVLQYRALIKIKEILSMSS